MKPFEIKENRNRLRDANGNPIEIVPVPDDDTLKRLTVQTIEDLDRIIVWQFA